MFFWSNILWVSFSPECRLAIIPQPTVSKSQHYSIMIWAALVTIKPMRISRGMFVTHPCIAEASRMPSHHNRFYALVELTACTAHSDTATALQLGLVTTVLSCVSKPHILIPFPNHLTPTCSLVNLLTRFIAHWKNLLHFPLLQTQKGTQRDNWTLLHMTA